MRNPALNDNIGLSRREARFAYWQRRFGDAWRGIVFMSMMAVCVVLLLTTRG